MTHNPLPLSQPAASAESACPLCGAPTHCGVQQGKSTCWCFTEPAVGPIAGVEPSQCVCRNCLHKARLSQSSDTAKSPR